jgi:hypothetical protein
MVQTRIRTDQQERKEGVRIEKKICVKVEEIGDFTFNSIQDQGVT